VPGNRVADGPAATPSPAAGGSPATGAALSERRKTTTVAVFNGTTTTGLAQRTREKLSGGGYSEGGRTDTAPDQTATQTTVYFAEGERRQAADAAKVIGGARLAPMNSDMQALAGPTAKLLVIVGSDKAP
jgi:hypothetical protein